MFKMIDYTPIVAPVMKGDKFSQSQYPQNELEKEQMKNIPYVSVVESLIHAQICIRPDITYVVEILDRYQNNYDLDHWKAPKKVMRYL